MELFENWADTAELYSFKSGRAGAVLLHLQYVADIDMHQCG